MGDGDAAAWAGASIEVPGYSIGELLGSGGFGQVVRAHHDAIGRDVAIKVLHPSYCNDPDAVARFVAEARAVAMIAHPGIVDVYDFGRLADGRQYCVMELVRGRTLRDVLRERGRLPLAEALPILRAIAEAIDAAHAAGVAHRDLKPDNVFVLDDGGVKLIDFGLAKLTRDDAPAVTATGSVFGTPLYMSPEQCRGKAIGLPTDAYSFGALAYHVLVGEPPFEGDALSLALHHLNDEPQAPSKRCDELDARVDRVILALLAKDPAQRPSPLAPAVAAIAGEAALPRRRLRHGVILAAAGAAAVIGIAIFGGSAPAASDCAPAKERLVGIWDEPTRSSLAARFAAVQRADAPSTWQQISNDLDAYSARWSRAWEGACAAGDRESDPLLYAQRRNCLENALLDLRGVSESMKTVDLTLFVQGWIGTFLHEPLENCENVDALRALPPAPAHEKWPEIAAQVLQIHVARAEVRASANGGRNDLVEAGITRLERVSKELAALHAPAAGEAAMFRAGFLLGRNDPRVEAAVHEAIDRSLEVRNDISLTQSYMHLARLELGRTRRDFAKIEDALARADAAWVRAGRPEVPYMFGDDPHIELALVRGEYAEAARLATARWPHPEDAMSERNQNGDGEVETTLALAGRHADAVAFARSMLAGRIAAWGTNHRQVAYAHANLEIALARAGDTAGALAELQAALAIFEAIHWQPDVVQSGYVHELAYALALGQMDTFATALEKLRQGTTIDPGSDVWTALAERTNPGFPALRAYAIARAHSPITDDLRLDQAFQLDDMPALRAAAKVAFARPAPSFADRAVVYAHLGNRDEAERALADAKKHPPSNEAELLGWSTEIGNAELDLGRAKDARATLERAVDHAGAWSHTNGSLVDLELSLGRARVESGDPAAALEPLYDALVFAFRVDRIPTWLPEVQLALARALWDSGGDRARARAFAENARDYSSRLGRSSEPASAWLAAHPL